MTTEFEALRRQLAGAGGRRPLLGGLAALPLMGPGALLLTEEDAAAKRKRAQAEKKKKPKTLQLCLNGQTVSATKKKAKNLRKQGATSGACSATTPAPCVPDSWTPQAAFGSAGSGVGQLSGQQGASLTADARTLAIADTSNFRVSIWTRPTATSAVWSPAHTFGAYTGNTPDSLEVPYDVAISPDGRTAWVLDFNFNRVSIWQRSSATSADWAHQANFSQVGSGDTDIGDPMGLTLSPDTKTLWVADAGNDRISVWERPHTNTHTWTHVTNFGETGSGPGGFSSGVAIVCSADTRTVWVADDFNRRISIWQRSTATSTDWAPVGRFGEQGSALHQFGLPRRLAMDASERSIWVADTENSRVVRWSRPNTASHTWTAEAIIGGTGPQRLQLIGGIAVTSDGLTLLASGNGQGAMWQTECLG